MLLNMLLGLWKLVFAIVILCYRLGLCVDLVYFTWMPDTSATRVRHEQHECDTQYTSAKGVKNVDFCQNTFEKCTAKTELCNCESYIKTLYTKL